VLACRSRFVLPRGFVSCELLTKNVILISETPPPPCPVLLLVLLIPISLIWQS
jgi:hypothetical protein